MVLWSVLNDFYWINGYLFEYFASIAYKVKGYLLDYIMPVIEE